MKLGWDAIDGIIHTAYLKLTLAPVVITDDDIENPSLVYEAYKKTFEEIAPIWRKVAEDTRDSL